MSGYATEWAVEAAKAKGLDPTARWVLVAMAYRASAKWGRCYAGAETIAEDTGFSERAVRMAMTRIRESEVVDVYIRAGQSAIWVFPTPPRKENPGLGLFARYDRNGSDRDPGTTIRTPRNEVPRTPEPAAPEQVINKRSNKSDVAASLAPASDVVAYCQPPPSTWHPAMPPMVNRSADPDDHDEFELSEDRPAKADFVAVMLETACGHLGQGRKFRGGWNADTK